MLTPRGQRAQTMENATLAQFKNMPHDERVRVVMRAAMRQKLRDTIVSPTPDALAWFEAVAEDLKARIRAFTPNRTDLCQAWDDGFDVGLLVQMVKHHAVDETDVDTMIELVFDRLQLICAPVQDGAVKHARQTLAATTPASQKLASLVDVSAAIVGDIEKLLASVPQPDAAIEY